MSPSAIWLLAGSSAAWVVCAVCALDLARRDRGRIEGRAATVAALFAGLCVGAGAFGVLDGLRLGGDAAGRALAAALVGAPLAAAMVFCEVRGRTPILYLPDLVFLTALATVAGIALLPLFLGLLAVCLGVQRWRLSRRRGGRRVRHQPLFLPAVAAWVPCAALTLIDLFSH